MSDDHSQRRVLWKPSDLHFDFPLPDKSTRFQHLQLYISLKCSDDPTFSRVKLYKILFYSDFEAFGRYGTPITGWSYKKFPLGPVPTAAEDIQAEMVRNGLIVMVDRPVWDYSRQRMVALKEPDYDLFTAKQIAIVESWIRFFWNMPARAVSKHSHGKAWAIAGLYEAIPYESVFISDDPVTEEDVARVRELAARYNWKM